MASDNQNALTETPTPAALGYRMPAEWAPHAATWLSWPHNAETWPGTGHLEKAERVLAEAVARCAKAKTSGSTCWTPRTRRTCESC